MNNGYYQKHNQKKEFTLNQQMRNSSKLSKEFNDEADAGKINIAGNPNLRALLLD